LRVTGHVFHPGHDELHGVTVVVTGTSGRTYVGRWHERGARGITMKDVAIHDPDRVTTSIDEWIGKQRRFGVAATEKMLVVPNEEAGEVRLLDEER
jgi:hypothetical protein